MMESVECFADVILEEQNLEYKTRIKIASTGPEGAQIVTAMPQLMLPTVDQSEPYREKHRSNKAKRLDENLLLVRKWLRDPTQKPEGMSDGQYTLPREHIISCVIYIAIIYDILCY